MNSPHENRAWRAFGESVRGASHERLGLPNQDAFRSWIDPRGGAAILALSDGHGGESHPRSDRGANLAVDLVVEYLQTFLERTGPRRWPDSESIQAFPREVAGHWRQAVENELRREPLKEADFTRLSRAPEQRQQLEAEPVLAYGATMLAVLATPGWVLFAQIGDGDFLCVAPDGVTSRAFAPDKRFVANLTTSLCQPQAWEQARLQIIGGNDSPLPALILGATDGYANSFRSDADFLQIGPDYLRLLHENRDDLRPQLTDILKEASHEGSGDDITIGILQRMDAQAAKSGRWQRVRRRFSELFLGAGVETLDA